MSDVLRVELEPSRITGLEAAGEYAEGLRLIKTHNKVPPRFTYRVFQHARKTLAVLDDGVASWLLATPSKRVKTTPDLARRVDALAEAGYHEWTSLDGVLSAIKWDETRPRFVITDELTGRRIECRFKPEDLPRVKEALPFRVEVAGRTRFNWLGEPVAIDVAEWDKIEADTDLPLVEDMEDLNITNGLDAAEFVRRLRHGD